MDVTVTAFIQQDPAPGAPLSDELAVQELTQTAHTYLAAVAEVEQRVPDGWRVLYVERTDEDSSTGAVGASGTHRDPRVGA